MNRLIHKISLFSTVILIILLALPDTVLADSGKGENEFTKTINGYQITLIFEKPAAVGSNQIHVWVNDAQNMPIANGVVEVSAVKSETEHTEAEAHTSADDHMADMPGMDMSGASSEAPSTAHDKMIMTSLKAGLESGEYAGEIAIESSGRYSIRVHLTVQGKLTEVDFPLNIVQPQNGSGILLSFFAVNVVILTAAVILKPKRVSAVLPKGA